MAHDKSQPGASFRIKARGKVQDGEGEEAMTMSTGMSAERRALDLVNSVGSLARDLTDDLKLPVFTRIQLITLIALVIKEAETAARADERVKPKTFQQLKEWNETATSWYEAGWREAIGAAAKNKCSGCENEMPLIWTLWDSGPAGRGRWQHTIPGRVPEDCIADDVRKLKLPEPQPVERISEADHKTLDTLHREGSY